MKCSSRNWAYDICSSACMCSQRHKHKHRHRHRTHTHTHTHKHTHTHTHTHKHTHTHTKTHTHTHDRGAARKGGTLVAHERCMHIYSMRSRISECSNCLESQRYAGTHGLYTAKDVYRAPAATHMQHIQQQRQQGSNRYV